MELDMTRLMKNTSSLLKIKLLCNRKKARKEVRCISIEKVVDSDLTNIKDLVESIKVECPPSYLEVAHIQYYDDVMRTFQKQKVITIFIGYCDASEPYEPITKWEFDDQMQKNKNIEKYDDSYLRNPLPHNEHVGVDEEGIYLDNKDYIIDDDSEDGSEIEDAFDVVVEEDEESSSWLFAYMQSHMNLNSKQIRVHHVGSGPTIQGKN
ncbi:hypothetical protein BS78_02G131300 [Paspalum vaginatum]|nr:hypothetical protein BS78_02G131300 [Paspalum vaginatum]